MKFSVCIIKTSALLLAAGLLASGCGEDATQPDPATGGKKASGGSPSSGGAQATGGQENKGGSQTGGVTGGKTSGGATATGGTQSGGSTTGGTPSSGGGSSPGGSGGATSVTGGASAGGAAGGTTSGTGGTPPVSTTPGFDYYKPRVIATTDGEKDDKSTMVRFLMYSSDFDVAGIVQVNSRYQEVGHSNEKWVEKEIGLYSQTLANLRKHNPDYPDPAKLSAVVKVGNENGADEGDKKSSPTEYSTKATEGSTHIINVLLDNDERPVHVNSWGGANTTAWALYEIKTTRTPAEFEKAVKKIRIYCIWYQDNGGQWIENNIPEAKIYEAYDWDDTWDYGSLKDVNPAEVKAFMDQSWFKANVGAGHGPLGEYAQANQNYVSEGDTPAFLPLINNGLNQHIDYTWGGWGGRGIYDKAGSNGHMTDGERGKNKNFLPDDGANQKNYWRWIINTSKDFAARMDWAVTADFTKANHAPKAQIVGELQRTVAVGEKVVLDGTPSSDPDAGQKLSFKWWHYKEVGMSAKTGAKEVTLENATTPVASFTPTESEKGKELHMLLEVKDDGTPDLMNWKRVIVKVQ
jgi:hypothetical protein